MCLECQVMTVRLFEELFRFSAGNAVGACRFFPFVFDSELFTGAVVLGENRLTVLCSQQPAGVELRAAQLSLQFLPGAVPLSEQLAGFWGLLQNGTAFCKLSCSFASIQCRLLLPACD